MLKFYAFIVIGIVLVYVIWHLTDTKVIPSFVALLLTIANLVIGNIILNKLEKAMKKE